MNHIKEIIYPIYSIVWVIRVWLIVYYCVSHIQCILYMWIANKQTKILLPIDSHSNGVDNNCNLKLNLLVRKQSDFQILIFF